jgi:hypothetical protein
MCSSGDTDDESYQLLKILHPEYGGSNLLCSFGRFINAYMTSHPKVSSNEPTNVTYVSGKTENEIFVAWFLDTKQNFAPGAVKMKKEGGLFREQVHIIYSN